MTAEQRSQGYAGDLSAAGAWALLDQEPDAQLIDVRTSAEWTFVGLPDLSPIGRKLHCLEWQGFPSMALNGDFVKQASSALGENKGAPVLFLCRSGARSRAAAIVMTGAGYTRSFNIAGGFEGDLDPLGHRGGMNGWKAAGLPWVQT